MSDPATLNPFSLPPELAVEKNPRNLFTRPIVAVLLSTLVPGSGLFLLKRRGQAYFLVSFFLVFLLLFWPFRILKFYWGFLTICVTGLALYLCSGISSCLGLAGTSRKGKFWVIPVIAASLLGFSFTFRLGIRASGFRIFEVPSTSMERTINPGDRIVVDTRYFSHRAPEREEIIVFQHDSIILVKRAIGVGGDFVQGSSGRILVNGAVIQEPYVLHSGSPPFWMQTFGPIFVVSHHFFVMGDNRDVSFDSRSPRFGLVAIEEVIGTPLYVERSNRQGAKLR